MKNYFDFKNLNRDFPYYNHVPKISKTGWLVLFLCLVVAIFSQALIDFKSPLLEGIFFCFILLIPLLYFSDWDYNLIFHKPSKNEIAFAILLFIGYMVYAFVVSEVLSVFSLMGKEGIESIMNFGIIDTVSLVFSLMGEELLKFIPLMFFMRCVYKYTSDRKLSIAISSVIILICFGLIHYAPPYNTLASVLLIQGLGSIFEIYGYIKTKNVFVPYISHLCTDVSIYLLMMLGF